MSLLTYNFESEYLNSAMPVYIIMPNRAEGEHSKDFFSSKKKYPVLWLLHGTFGDGTDWIRRSNIELYANEMDLIVVMPCGLNTDFLNWGEFARGFDMEKYVIDELMPFVYNWLPASDKREDNYIAGLSMGGMAAAQFATWYPEKFIAAGLFSGFPRNWHNDFVYDDKKRTENIIAVNGGREGLLKTHYNVWDELAKIDKNSLPAFYVSVGGDDYLKQAAYEPFKEYAEKLGLNCTYEVIDGYHHEWRFWDLTLRHALDKWGFKVVKPD